MPAAPQQDGRNVRFVTDFLDGLVASGRLEPAARDRALQAQRQTGQRIDIVLTELGMLPAAVLLEAVATHIGKPIVGADAFPDTPILQHLLTAEFVRRARVVPLSDRGDDVLVAAADPFNDEELQAVGYFIGRRIEARLAAPVIIDAAIDRLYGGAGDNDTPAGGGTGGAGTFVNEDDVQRLRDIASEAPIVRFVQRVLTSAASQRASDVHIEPLADCVRVRFRIDGVMAEVERVPRDLQAGIASRLKILARLNVAERRLPQDGRMKIALAGQDIDVRVSLVPTAHGESAVLRLLDQSQMAATFNSLGFDKRSHGLFGRLLADPHGLVLVTGPTGSGKTTTLYAALQQLNTVARKVFTVEDPIEYEVAGVNQMQVHPNIGLDFVHCLRSILRQDPDVIMIGEMRDVETARTAVRASLTGHLVLSTLHTNSAASSVTRLLDMGVEDYLLASTLTGIVAQRLVRRLCFDCRTAQPIKLDQLRAMLGIEGDGLTDGKAEATVFRPKGCPACRGTGYAGRTVIAETLVVDDAIRDAITQRAGYREIEIRAKRGGMQSLAGSGLDKVLAGDTAVDEVLRVTRL